MPSVQPDRQTFTPRYPNLAAFGLCCLWILVLSLPMWSGQLLAGPMSDQFATGYAMRHWGAEQWKLTGHPPLWNPLIFAGLPTTAGFGDLFYPTAWLRLILPTAFAMDLAFVVHYVLAGFFAYLLLRLLGISWTGAVTGGTSYQLSGVVVSLVSPGHDGKLFVTALLPLMLIGLVLAVRKRRPEGFALFALAVGLALLSPQYQMTQYALVTAGLFTLYLTFGEPQGLSPRERYLALGGAAAAVIVGFGVSMIQVLPFFHYIPYSPRAEAGGYAWSTSYALPWIHVPELFLSGFAGSLDTYWGPNAIKLHSEYLGLPVIALAVLGAGSSRRRLVYWLSGIGLLFLLVCLGDGTPFYRLWWAVVPYVNKTRAPGMALYVVALVISTLAAFGVERIERGEGRRLLQGALFAGGAVALLAVAGVFGNMAVAYAQSHATVLGTYPTGAAAAAQPGILAGALGSAVALAAVAGLCVSFFAGKVSPRAFGITLVLLVGADFWRAGRGFWHWSDPEQGLFRADPIVQRVKAAGAPDRLLDFGDVYGRHTLMRHDISQVLGESASELRFYDDLMGGRNEWRFMRSLQESKQLWRLLAVRYVVLPETLSVPGFHLALGPVQTSADRPAYLYEADTVPPYARVVPAAIKADTGAIIPTLLDPRLDYDRLVLFSPDQPVNPLPVSAMPAPSPSHATVKAWAPGKMIITLDPAPPQASYLLISENWYPDWHASVDGSPAQILRGDWTFLTIPVPAGAHQVALHFASRDYARGRMIMFASLLLIFGGLVGPMALRRRATGASARG